MGDFHKTSITLAERKAQVVDMPKIKIYEVKRSFVTYEYKRFKHLIGNREASKKRQGKIQKSVLEVGWIPARIIVNENMEVVEGQGRLQVAEKYHLPVYVDVVPGIGVEECQVMNDANTTWSTKDAIYSNAEKGNVNYKYIKALFDEYGSSGVNGIMVAVNPSYRGYGTSILKSGKAKCSQQDYEKARERLAYITPFDGLFLAAKVRKEFYYTALVFALGCPDVDKQSLAERMRKYPSMIESVVDIPQAVKCIDKIYNYRRSKKDHVYITHAYERSLNV